MLSKEKVEVPFVTAKSNPKIPLLGMSLKFELVLLDIDEAVVETGFVLKLRKFPDTFGFVARTKFVMAVLNDWPEVFVIV